MWKILSNRHNLPIVTLHCSTYLGLFQPPFEKIFIKIPPNHNARCTISSAPQSLPLMREVARRSRDGGREKRKRISPPVDSCQPPRQRGLSRMHNGFPLRRSWQESLILTEAVCCSSFFHRIRHLRCSPLLREKAFFDKIFSKNAFWGRNFKIFMLY